MARIRNGRNVWNPLPASARSLDMSGRPAHPFPRPQAGTVPTHQPFRTRSCDYLRQSAPQYKLAVQQQQVLVAFIADYGITAITPQPPDGKFGCQRTSTYMHAYIPVAAAGRRRRAAEQTGGFPPGVERALCRPFRHPHGCCPTDRPVRRVANTSGANPSRADGMCYDPCSCRGSHAQLPTQT